MPVVFKLEACLPPRCVLGVEEGVKWVQLHITCPLWIHNRLILMSFSKYSPLDPWETPKTVSKMPCFICVGWVSSWSWGCWGRKKGSSESSYTSHVHYGSITDWYWWVSANLDLDPWETSKTVPKLPCFFCVGWAISCSFWLLEKGQVSPARHHMSIMDP
jgi:hypothetical protein